MPEWCPECNAMLPDGLENCPRCNAKLSGRTTDGNDKPDTLPITLYVLGLMLIPLIIVLAIGIICILIGR
jgi:hypothetical protein